MSNLKKYFIVGVCLLLSLAVIFAALFMSGVIIATLVWAILIIIGCLLFAAALIAVLLILDKLRFDRYKSSPLNLPKGFTVTAHTGCCATKENSLESINAAIINGADIAELDLNFTADGTAVLSHNEPVGDEVTLEDAFKKLSVYPDLRVNVDVKSTADLKSVKALAEKYSLLGRIFYTGIYEKDVEAVIRQTPDIPYYLNLKSERPYSRVYINSLVERVKKSGAIGINLNKNGASKKLVDIFHKNGLLVSVWTADSEREMHRLLSYAPDNITTRRPDKLHTILKERML